MRRILSCKLLAVAALWAAYSFQPISADNIPFKISDYIPEKFIDFEWQVNGSFQLTGNNAESQSDVVGLQGRYEDRDWSGNQHRLDLGSNLRYRYETIQDFLTADLALSTRYYRQANEYTRFMFTSLNKDEVIENSGARRCFYIGVSPHVDVGKYAYRDFFVAANGYVSFEYYETPTNRVETHGARHYYDGEYYLFSDIHTTSDRRSDERRWSFGLELLPGWGRVYDGVFASTALYMIEELRSNGLLERTPTHEEMLALTELIYQYRLKHIIDSRIRRLEALTEILNYLQDRGVIDDPGPYGHLLIQDVWDYFPRSKSQRVARIPHYIVGRGIMTRTRGATGESRQFGTRIKVGLGADFLYNSSQQTHLYSREIIYTKYYNDSIGVIDTVRSYSKEHNYDHRKSTSAYVYLAGLIEHHVPVSRKWQVDLSAWARYYVYTDEDREFRLIYYRDTATHKMASILERDYDDYYSLGFWASALYIVDSRTSLYVQASCDYRQAEHKTVFKNYGVYSTMEYKYPNLDEKNWLFTLGGGVTYRISIPTTLLVKAAYDRGSREEIYDLYRDDYSRDSYGVSVTLSHHLF